MIIRDTEQCIGEHRWKQFVNPTQKQGRNTHSERKGMGILSKEEEGSESDTRQRETRTWRGVWASWVTRSTVHQKLGRVHTWGGVRRSTVQRWHQSQIWEPFWVYVNLSSIILVLSSHLTHTWILPKMHPQILLRWIPLERPMNVCLYLLWGGVPSFSTSKKLSCACADRKIFLDLRSGHLISLL